MERKENVFAKWTKKIEVYESQISVLECIEELGKKYNGKVINKRFFDDLSAQCDLAYYHIKDLYDGKFIDFAIKSNEYITCGWNGKLYNYVDNTTCRILSFGKLGRKPKQYIVNKRLDYDMLCESIKDRIAYIKDRIQSLKDAMTNYDNTIAMIDKVNEQLNELNNKLAGGPIWIHTSKVEFSCI